MRLAIALAGLLLLAGCQRSTPPPPEAHTRAEAASPAPAVPKKREQEPLERMAAYMKEHPWGEHTGQASIRGRVAWSEDGGPLEPVVRRGIQLKGLKGGPLQGIYYTGRTNEDGEFVFDRILPGQYELTDFSSRWNLTVTVRDGEQVTLELSPSNATDARVLPTKGNEVSESGNQSKSGVPAGPQND